MLKTDSEVWTVFHGRRRRIVAGASSSHYKQKLNGLVTADRQGMYVVTAGSEGAAGESSPDCPHRTTLYYNKFVLPRAYNQSVPTAAAICARTDRQNEHAPCRNPGNRGVSPFVYVGPFSQTREYRLLVAYCAAFLFNQSIEPA